MVDTIAMFATGIIAGSAMVATFIGILHLSRIAELAYQKSVRKKQAPIIIEESPPPTHTTSSPRTSPPVSKPYLRRVGKSRVKAHSRKATKVYSPNLPGKCGYQAALWISGYKPTEERVKNLRKHVSHLFEEKRVSQTKVEGIDLHSLLQAEEKSPRAYAAEIRASQWASKVELALAAECLSATYMYVENGCAEKDGDMKPKYMIKLEGMHFVVKKIHAKIKTKGYGGIARGGMHAAWTAWQREPMRQHPTHPQEQMTAATYVSQQQQIHVYATAPPGLSLPRQQETAFVDLLDIQQETPRHQQQQAADADQAHEDGGSEDTIPECAMDNMDTATHHSNDQQGREYTVHLPTESTSITTMTLFFHNEITMKIKTIAATAIGVPHYDLRAQDMEGNEVSDWSIPPSTSKLMKRTRYIPNIMVKIALPQRAETFMLDVCAAASAEEIQQRVANVLAIDYDEIKMYTEEGDEITHDFEEEMVVVLGQRRGGMRRSVTPTQPYEGCQDDRDEETSEEIREARWRDQVESTGQNYPSPRSNASRSRSRSPMSSLARGSASPTRHGWHSAATPPLLQPAQHEPYLSQS